jgi:hypothetical protein
MADHMASGSLAPTSKVTAAGVGGAAALIVVWVLSLFHVDVPTLVSAALTLVASFGAGYVIPERNPVDPPVPPVPPTPDVPPAA